MQYVKLMVTGIAARWPHRTGLFVKLSTNRARSWCTKVLTTDSRSIASQWLTAGLLLLVCGTPLMAHAELPIEQLGIAVLPEPNHQRLYLTDPSLGHIVDGRVHVIDGGTMRYLGLIGAGFAAATALSNDGKYFFLATTYHSRLQRGTRTDVVEAYRTADLRFEYEIEIPPRHAQALQIKALMRQTSDGRYLLVQNATPAASVTVVDLQTRKVTAEIPNSGCWGVIPWPQPKPKFSSVCGDGTLATFELDANGGLASRSSSARFFDSDADPIFMHYQMVNQQLVFVSYGGSVYTADLSGAVPTFLSPWSLLDAQSRKQGWRPGGMALFAVDPRSGRLVVGMHPKGTEGSHKNPAQELWAFDLQQRKRLARGPGHAAVSMAMTSGARPELIVLNGMDNSLVAFDPISARGLNKPLRKSAPFGEMPVYIETH